MFTKKRENNKKKASQKEKEKQGSIKIIKMYQFSNT